MSNIIYIDFKKSGSKPVELLDEQKKIKEKYKPQTWYLQTDSNIGSLPFWDTYLHEDCILIRETQTPPFMH